MHTAVKRSKAPRTGRHSWRCTVCPCASVLGLTLADATVLAAEHCRKTGHRVEIAPRDTNGP